MVPRESQGSAWNPDSPSPVTPVSAKASWPEIWRIWSPSFLNFINFINFFFFNFFKFSLGFSYFLDLGFHLGKESLRNGPMCCAAPDSATVQYIILYHTTL